jgi:YgiT-type zinc finger domain-containing protein
MGNTNTTEDAMNNLNNPTQCSFQTCAGEYEDRIVTFSAKTLRGVMVIDDVPARVCKLCGDVTYSFETSQQIDVIIRSGTTTEVAPLFHLSSLHELV